MPINYRHYHPDWKDIIRPEILKRDNYRCRICGAPNKKEIVRTGNGSWIEADDLVKAEAQKTGQKITRVIITVAHLNHIVTDNRPENLMSMCQLHHTRHDAPHKVAMRKVAKVWCPKLAVEMTTRADGHLYLNHLFVLARARRNTLAQLYQIKGKRVENGYNSKYDDDLSELIEKTLEEYHFLVKRSCYMLSSHYGIKDHDKFFNDYWGSDLKIIGITDLKGKSPTRYKLGLPIN